MNLWRYLSYLPHVLVADNFALILLKQDGTDLKARVKSHADKHALSVVFRKLANALAQPEKP